MSATTCFYPRVNQKYFYERLYDWYIKILEMRPSSVRWCDVTISSVFSPSAMIPYHSCHCLLNLLLFLFDLLSWMSLTTSFDWIFRQKYSAERPFNPFWIYVVLRNHVIFIIWCNYLMVYTSYLHSNQIYVLFIHYFFMKQKNHLENSPLKTELIISNLDVINFSVVWLHLVQSSVQVPTWWWDKSSHDLIGA